VSERPVQQIDATNWTAYYEKPFFLSRVTRPMGMLHLVKLLKNKGVPRGASFVELGGGNSCLFDAIRREFSPKRYVAVDANDLGLKLLRERVPDGMLEVVCRDLLVDAVPGEPYDVVVSIGLIEHFDSEGTRVLVQRHFEAARSGGIVLMTFPTPTGTYRVSRRISEGLGMWKFPDERPLDIGEVLAAVDGRGEVVYTAIGRWTPFTQAVVLVRKR
jgi:cyclopropane fatty-acyl-phospholipid synthase-like methyltransferase